MKLSDDRILAGQLAYRVDKAIHGEWKKEWENNPYVSFTQLLHMYNKEITHLESSLAEAREESASLTASDKEGWAWIDSVCAWLECGNGGVFEIEDKIKALKCPTKPT